MTKLNDGHNAELELFKFDTCPYCRLVLDQIEAQGIEGVQLRDIRTEEGAADELVARGGKLQVPALFVNGDPLYESKDILAWLEAEVVSTKGEKERVEKSQEAAS